MEKKSRRRSKILAVVLTTVVLLTTLTMQIFADFAGDGVSSGTRVYMQSNISAISISQISGGATSTLDNVVYSPIPMYSDGALTSEVSRGVYGNDASQFYRYTTQITRFSGGVISQKVTFDTPLFNSATSLQIKVYIPLVTNNAFDFIINAVTNDIQGNCRITRVSVDFATSMIVPMYNSDYTEITASMLPTTFSASDTSPGEFPYTFRLADIVGETHYELSEIISAMEITFDVTCDTPGVFSFSLRDEYTSSRPDTPYVETIFNNPIPQPLEPVYIDEIPFAQAVVNSLSDIAEIELFGAFSIGDLLWGFVGIMALLAFLKLYAGG